MKLDDSPLSWLSLGELLVGAGVVCISPFQQGPVMHLLQRQRNFMP
jgi:hypothetical protein